MTYTFQFANTTEAISATDLMAVANAGAYHVVSGCGQSYSISDMVVTVAAGVVTVAGEVVEVAGDTVTLVADADNDRWALIWVDDDGDVGITHGDAAATPLVPSLTATQTMIAKVLVDEDLTIANSATVKLDKRAPGGGVSAAITIDATEPESPEAGQLWVDITDDEHPLVYIAREDGA